MTRPARTSGAIAVDNGSPADGRDVGVARLQQRDGGLALAYRCPLHATDHVAPYTPALAREFLTASADRLCCCPQGAVWSVRHGLARTRLLGWLLATLWLANLGDLLLTLHALAVGRATEVNGLMSYFLHAGSLAVAVFKVGLVSAAVVLFWLLRRRSVVLPATAVLTLTFVALVVYEAFSLASR